MKISILILLISSFPLSSCSNDDKDSENSIQKCSDPIFLLDLTEEIPATVSIVEAGEPFFHGIETYYKVDAETYIPSLFAQNEQKFIRIFPTSKINEKAGDKVKIKGKLSTCLTGNHGLLTNDYKGFYILEQP